MKEGICNAIKNKKLIEFTYDGFYRVIEPFTFGINDKGNEIFSAYQFR